MNRHGEIVRRTGQEHRQELMKLIKQAAYMHSIWQIWDDLMFITAATLSQPLHWVQAREDEYHRRFGSYDKKIQALFPRMIGEIILAFEQEGLVDILGGMYMELELSNHWHGQFFTPDSVCRAIAQMQYHDTAEQIEELGYITVNDPTCGGGAMLIAFASVCRDKDVNYQRDVLFVGQDIDPVVAHMCYISMSLLGMPGYVIIGNTLLMDTENFDYWFTPMYFIHGFQWRCQRKALNDIVTGDAAEARQESESPGPIPTQAEGQAVLSPEDTPLAATVDYNVNTVGQLTLFK